MPSWIKTSKKFNKTHNIRSPGVTNLGDKKPYMKRTGFNGKLYTEDSKVGYCYQSVNIITETWHQSDHIKWLLLRIPIEKLLLFRKLILKENKTSVSSSSTVNFVLFSFEKNDFLVTFLFFFILHSCCTLSFLLIACINKTHSLCKSAILWRVDDSRVWIIIFCKMDNNIFCGSLLSWRTF